MFPKSVRFNLPEGGLGQLTGSEGSDQGYESDQSRVREQLLQTLFFVDISANGGVNPVSSADISAKWGGGGAKPGQR